MGCYQKIGADGFTKMPLLWSWGIEKRKAFN